MIVGTSIYVGLGSVNYGYIGMVSLDSKEFTPIQINTPDQPNRRIDYNAYFAQNEEFVAVGIEEYLNVISKKDKNK